MDLTGAIQPAGNPWQWMDYSTLSGSQKNNIIPQAQRYIQQQLGAGQAAPQVYGLPGGQYTTQIPQSILSPSEIGQISNQPNQDSSNVEPGMVWALPGGGFTPKEPSAQGYAPAKSSGGKKSFFDYLAPVAGAALGSIIPGLGTGIGAALGAGLGSGVSTGARTGNPLSGALAGLGSAGGSFLGSQFLGPELAGLGSGTSEISGGATPGFLGQTFGDTFGDFAGNSISNQTLGSLAGGAAGSSIGSSAGSMAGGMLNSPNSGNQMSFGFTPSAQQAQGLPQSLSQFAGLSPNQQASNIATKGVYGGGNGPDETNYFMNLMNRSLFSNGSMASDTSGINPTQMNYLNQLGVSGSSPTDLAKGISSYGT